MGLFLRNLRLALSGVLALVVPVVAALGIMMASVGGASAVSCGTSSVTFSATANVGITCGDYGNGNDINGGGGDDPGLPGLAGFGGAGIITGFPADGALTLTGVGTTSGTWSVTAPVGFVFSSLVIALQGAVPQTNPDWAWFNLAAGTLSSLTGNWSITSDNGKTLERAYIYGALAAVPVPAGIALGATALGLLGLMGWRRKKVAAAA